MVWSPVLFCLGLGLLGCKSSDIVKRRVDIDNAIAFVMKLLCKLMSANYIKLNM